MRTNVQVCVLMCIRTLRTVCVLYSVYAQYEYTHKTHGVHAVCTHSAHSTQYAHCAYAPGTFLLSPNFSLNVYSKTYLLLLLL